MKEQTEGKSNLEIAKEIIKQNIGEAQHGIFCTRNLVGDQMFTIYSKVGLTIDICYDYEYFEVFGLTHDEFKQLEGFYYNQLGHYMQCIEERKGNAMKINVMLDDGAFMPERAHPDDAGLDLRSPVDEVVNARGYCTIDTGVHVAIPKGMVGFLKSKSGLNVKHHITGEGVIDSGYTGSVVVKLYNEGFFDYLIHRGDKIIQLVILPIVTPVPVLAEKLDDTERGDKGFGSTGK